MQILYEAKLGGKFLSVGSEQIPSAQYFTTRDYTPWAHIQTDKKKLKEIPPCVYAAPVVAYLNDPKTRDALHIDKTAKVWDLCANVDYASARAGSIDVYPILKGKYRMLKYSGDADGSVPTAGTLQWIQDLNWTVTDPWRAYYITDEVGQQQVAGYVEVREGGFTFASVHGAGHMAPQWKRQ